MLGSTAQTPPPSPQCRFAEEARAGTGWPFPLANSTALGTCSQAGWTPPHIFGRWTFPQNFGACPPFLLALASFLRTFPRACTNPGQQMFVIGPCRRVAKLQEKAIGTVEPVGATNLEFLLLGRDLGELLVDFNPAQRGIFGLGFLLIFRM